MIRTSAWLLAAVVLVAPCLAYGAARASEPEPWRQLASTPPYPPALNAPMGVYDAARHRVLEVDVYGFRKPPTVFAIEPGPEPSWSMLQTSGTPPLDFYVASVVLDPVRDRLLLIGSGGGQPIGVWALTLSGTPTWEKLVNSGDPPDRNGQSTIYDPVHDRVVMFGGVLYAGSSVYCSEVWCLSLASRQWTRVTMTGPVPGGREGHGAMYDPGRQRMVVFGGHYENGTRGFWNDLWELSLGDTMAWSEIPVPEPLPGARSAFGTVYDPIRRRMLVHGGVNAQSGIEPDDLWAFALDGTPAWTPIVPEDTLRGRSYPADVYDPDADRLLACGGGGYPQVSALSLSAPARWDAVLPACCPLSAPGAHSGHAVLYDSRRDQFLVVGGDYSSADSVAWIFDTESGSHWRALRTSAAPYPGFSADQSQATVYDSLGDRVITFDGWQVWAKPASGPGEWTAFGPPPPTDAWPARLGSAAGLAIDTRRNRLLLSGGYVYYAHSAGYSMDGVWALSLGSEPAWSQLGELPTGSYGHTAFYDPIRDRMVIVGGAEVYDSPRSRHWFGAVVWSTPVDSMLQWTKHSEVNDGALSGPPNAHVAYDHRTDRLFLASDSTVRVRTVDGPGSWAPLACSTPSPTITNAIAYDPVRDQLLALFAAPAGATTVDAWALVVGPMAVTLLSAERTPGDVTLRLRSVTAYGHAATIERREEDTAWQVLGGVEFDVDGSATFTDTRIQPGHDYHYRVAVADSSAVWRSVSYFVPDPGSLQFALLGSRPNPAVGTIRLAFSLPAAGPASLDVFDICGRRRSSRDVGALGQGIHSLHFVESSTWGAGVYYARLRRGGESRTMKIVLVK